MDEHESETDTHKTTARVFAEEAKQRQVTHWDWDYLPREELDRRLTEEVDQPKTE